MNLSIFACPIQLIPFTMIHSTSQMAHGGLLRKCSILGEKPKVPDVNTWDKLLACMKSSCESKLLLL